MNDEIDEKFEQDFNNFFIGDTYLFPLYIIENLKELEALGLYYKVYCKKFDGSILYTQLISIQRNIEEQKSNYKYRLLLKSRKIEIIDNLLIDIYNHEEKDLTIGQIANICNVSTSLILERIEDLKERGEIDAM